MKDHKNENHKSIIDTLELPRDLFCGEPIFTMTGDGELLIENHRGIVFCSGEQVVVRAKNATIRVSGQKLQLEFYSSDGLMIRGRIESIGIGAQ